MRNNEAYDVRVRQAVRYYFWLAYFTDSNKRVSEIGHGYCFTDTTAWLAGIKCVKAHKAAQKDSTP